MKITIISILFFLGILLCILPIPGAAQQADGLPSVPVINLIGPTNPADIGSYQDHLFNQQMFPFYILQSTPACWMHK